MRVPIGIMAGAALIIGLVTPTASAQVPPLPDLPVDTGDLPVGDLPVDLPLDALDLDLLGPILECASGAVGDDPAGDVTSVADAGILLCIISAAVELLTSLLGDLPTPDLPAPDVGA